MITIEEVKAGLEKHKFKLCVGSMYRNSRNECCAIGASILSKIDTINDNLEDVIWDIAYDKYGKDYVRYFYLAFDDVGCIKDDVNITSTYAYKNGRQIREQAIELGLLCVL